MKNLVFTILAALVVGFSLNAQSLQNSGEAQIIQLQKEITALDDDHCEVPCGIYGDSLRVALLYEHASTVEKAMNQITELSAAENPNYNQIVRWVMNKESHAEEIQHIVSQYFLHQRVKPLPEKPSTAAKTKYQGQLESLHKVLVYAMKSKQTTDTANVKKLKKALHEFEHLYFKNHKH